MKLIILSFIFSIGIGQVVLGKISELNNFQLQIEKGKVEKRNDNTYWMIPVTLKNNSEDTIKYYSMSCSWKEFYSTDNQNLKIEIPLCEKNVPVIIEMTPGEIKPIHLELKVNQKPITKTKFKIGFNLMEVNKFDYDHSEQNKKENLIWSNTVIM